MKIDQKYLDNIKVRLMKYQDWLKQPIPKEAMALFDYTTMMNVVNAVWNNPLYKRPMSPLAKSFGEHNIPVSAPYSYGERQYIEWVAEHLHEVYGEPKFAYKDEMTHYNLEVKQWQSLLQLSPKNTGNTSKRRYDQFKDYLTKPAPFKPDIKILNQALELYEVMQDLGRITIDFTPSAAKGVFAKHDSNVGYPFFRNEVKTDKDGVSFRDKSVQLTNKLNQKYGASWMVSIPALIIGRDQQGKMDIDITKNWSYDELLAEIRVARYHPNKTRVVWAIDRISNNNANVVVNGIIQSESFQTNPTHACFWDRDRRQAVLARHYDVTVQEGNIDVNADVKSHDQNVTPEMIVIAHDYLFEHLDVRNAPADLFESMIAKFIYTKYIIYNPYTKELEFGHKSKAIPSGAGQTGVTGRDTADIPTLYALIAYYGYTYVRDQVHKYKAAGTSYIIGLGDDILMPLKSLSDLEEIAKIAHDAFGIQLASDSRKTSVGTDLLQEYYEPNHISYPVGRMMESALYIEKPKELGPAGWVMTWYSQLYNIRSNDERDLLACAHKIMMMDSMRLGLTNPQGKRISRSEFRTMLREELMFLNKKAKDLFWDGDPTKESRFTNDGDFASEYIDWCFNLAHRVVAVYDVKLS